MAEKGSTKGKKYIERLLVPIDATEASKLAIDYLARLGSLLKTSEITLCHVLPTIPPDMLEDGGSEDPKVERELKKERDEEICEWEGKLKAETKKVFEGYKKQLIESGIPVANINTTLVGRNLDIGKAIVEAAKEGGHSTIVVGRRGVSFLQELALGSVSYRVVKLAKDCTVWVVH